MNHLIRGSREGSGGIRKIVSRGQNIGTIYFPGITATTIPHGYIRGPPLN